MDAVGYPVGMTHPVPGIVLNAVRIAELAHFSTSSVAGSGAKRVQVHERRGMTAG